MLPRVLFSHVSVPLNFRIRSNAHEMIGAVVGMIGVVAEAAGVVEIFSVVVGAADNLVILLVRRMLLKMTQMNNHA